MNIDNDACACTECELNKECDQSWDVPRDAGCPTACPVECDAVASLGAYPPKRAEQAHAAEEGRAESMGLAGKEEVLV